MEMKLKTDMDLDMAQDCKVKKPRVATRERRVRAAIRLDMIQALLNYREDGRGRKSK